MTISLQPKQRQFLFRPPQLWPTILFRPQNLRRQCFRQFFSPQQAGGDNFFSPPKAGGDNFSDNFGFWASGKKVAEFFQSQNATKKTPPPFFRLPQNWEPEPLPRTLPTALESGLCRVENKINGRRRVSFKMLGHAPHASAVKSAPKTPKMLDDTREQRVKFIVARAVDSAAAVPKVSRTGYVAKSDCWNLATAC